MIQVRRVRIWKQASAIHKSSIGAVKVKYANDRRIDFQEAMVPGNLASETIFGNPYVTIFRTANNTRLRAVENVMTILVTRYGDINRNSWVFHDLSSQIFQSKSKNPFEEFAGR